MPVGSAQGCGGSFKDRKPIGQDSCCDALPEQTHWWTEKWLKPWVSLSLKIVPLSLSPSLSVFIYLCEIQSSHSPCGQKCMSGSSKCMFENVCENQAWDRYIDDVYASWYVGWRVWTTYYPPLPLSSGTGTASLTGSLAGSHKITVGYQDESPEDRAQERNPMDSCFHDHIRCQTKRVLLLCFMVQPY